MYLINNGSEYLLNSYNNDVLWWSVDKYLN